MKCKWLLCPKFCFWAAIYIDSPFHKLIIMVWGSLSGFLSCSRISLLCAFENIKYFLTEETTVFASSSILWLEPVLCNLLSISFQNSPVCLLKLHAAGLHNFYFFYFWCSLLTASLSLSHSLSLYLLIYLFLTQLFFEPSVGTVMLLGATSTLFSPANIPAISWLPPQSVWERNISMKYICIFFFLIFGNKHVWFFVSLFFFHRNGLGCDPLSWSLNSSMFESFIFMLTCS